VSLDFTTILTLGVVVLFVLFKFVLAKRTPADVIAAKLKAGATILDVRSEAEFRAGSYRGAVNVPLQALSSKLDRIPKDRPVVVFCASGSRSAMAARMLRKAGYDDVSNAGGLHHMP
jgi:phage shock protein E